MQPPTQIEENKNEYDRGEITAAAAYNETAASRLAEKIRE